MVKALKVKEQVEEHPAAVDNAAPKGDTKHTKKAPLAIGLDDVFVRLHNVLVKQGSGLLATMSKEASGYERAQWAIFECEVFDGGRVREIDMVARARELQVIEDNEVPAPQWYHPPVIQ